MKRIIALKHKYNFLFSIEEGKWSAAVCLQDFNDTELCGVNGQDSQDDAIDALFELMAKKRIE